MSGFYGTCYFRASGTGPQVFVVGTGAVQVTLEAGAFEVVVIWPSLDAFETWAYRAWSAAIQQGAPVDLVARIADCETELEGLKAELERRGGAR